MDHRRVEVREEEHHVRFERTRIEDEVEEGEGETRWLGMGGLDKKRGKGRGLTY